MKKLIALFALLFMGIAVFAQDTTTTSTPAGQDDEIRTLFGKNKPVKVGWFVGAQGGWTKFCSSDVALAGITAGVVINHNFSFGISAYGIANTQGLTYEKFIDNQDVRLEGGWGGFLAEYTLFPKSPVHITFPVMIGGGTLSYITKEEYYDPEDNDWDYDHDVLATDNFFVVEPGVRAEFNILKFMRFGAGVSYRYTPDLDLPNTSAGFINNFSVNGSLKFGKF